MNLLDLTLPTPAANLACDEALLDWCEGGECAGALRFWESKEYFVVLGYANRAGIEANVEACKKRNIPVLRRCSGGGAIVQGPGCLNYTLVLRIADGLESITETNCLVMQRNRDALRKATGLNVQIRGQTDLALEDKKFSGNAQRRRKNFLLFHGSFLLGFDLQLIEQVLKFPSRQPDYRSDRSHSNFLTRLNVAASAVKSALRNQWQADEPLENIPFEAIEQLASSRYADPAWNMKW